MADQTLGEWKLCRRCSMPALQEFRFCTRCGSDTWASVPPDTPVLTKTPAEEAALTSLVPWTALDVVKGVVFFVLFALSVTAMFILILLLTDGEELGPYALAATAMVEGMLVLSVWLFALSKYHVSWGALGLWKGPGIREIKIAVVVFIAGIAAQVVYLSILELVGVDTAGATPSTFIEENGAVLVLLSVLAIGVAPFAEEVFFRGFVYGGLANRFGVWWGALASAVLFALAHIEPIKMFPLLVLGLLLAWAYHRTGSLWTSVLAHLFNNSLALTVVLV